MKRYRFRLAAVLRLRRAEEEQARARLGEANLRLVALLVERDREVERYTDATRRPAPVDTTGLLAERYEADLAAARLAEAEHLVADAAASAAAAQVTWAAARRQVLALERLEERRRGEHRADVVREEIAQADDLVTARFATATGHLGGARR